MKVIAGVLLGCMFLVGCASKPRTPEEQVVVSIEQAKDSLATSSGVYTAASLIDNVVSLNTGPAKAREFLATNPRALMAYIAYLDDSIKGLSTPESAISLSNKLDLLRGESVIPASESAQLQTLLAASILRKNLSGDLPFTLADNTTPFPGLSSVDQQQAVVKNTIVKLKEKNSNRKYLPPLLAYASAQPDGSVNKRQIESELPSMNIRRSELEVVTPVYPAFATVRRGQMTASVLLSVKNGDRLMADDLQKYLGSNLKGITWAKADAPGTIKLEIEKIRENEKIIPESSQTITYAQHEVNLLSAALLMPRNASYIYTVTSGGAEIEYGFGITAVANGEKIHDDLVRGKVGGTYARCDNARIQNVFGGVTSAGFVANDDMQRRCNGQQSVQVEDLRRDVLSKILASVQNVPQIATAQLD